jgi:hypothetical protein
MLDAVIVHPFLEDREIRIGFFALDSSIGRQDDGQGEASSDPFNNEGLSGTD